MYVYLIVALQVYCIYHLWKTGRSFYWIFLIVFIPLVGCLVYLLTQVINKRDVDQIQQGVTQLVNPSKRITDLQAAVEFADTYQNRVALADALCENQNWSEALPHYLAALEGNFKTDYYLNSRLLEVQYMLENYNAAADYGSVIKENPQFETTTTAFIYGMVLDKLGKSDEAAAYLKSVDKRYSNFNERVTLAEYYIENSKNDEAKEVLDELIEESRSMRRETKQQFKIAFAKAGQLREAL